MRLLRFLPLLLLFAACDIIEAPYYENPASQLPADEQCLADAAAAEPFSEPIRRKVLVEEMTGHQCGNCPEAGELIHTLKANTFPGQMVVVAIHAGALALPKSSGEKFTTDFRSSKGNQLYSQLNPFDVVPLGLINRDAIILGAGSYQSEITKALNESPEAGLRIFNCFDPDSLTLTSVVDIKYLIDAPASDRLILYVIEDNIVDWQKDYRFNEPDLPDYTHKSVFRDAITSVSGTEISSGAIAPDDTFTLSFTYQLNPGWDPTNCKVVAFIYDTENEIVRQAEEAFVID